MKFWFNIIRKRTRRFPCVMSLFFFFFFQAYISQAVVPFVFPQLPLSQSAFLDTVTIMCNFQQRAHNDSISANRCRTVILMSALPFRPFHQRLVDVSAALFIAVITFRRTISKQAGQSSSILLCLRTRS